MIKDSRKISAHAKQKGFSLTELLIVIVIIGILAGIAIPSINQFLGNTQISSTAGTLLSNIAYARAEAAKRGDNIVLCPANLDNQQQIILQCKSGSPSSWTNAYIVYVEHAGDIGKIDSPGNSSGDTILRQEKIPETVNIQSSFNQNHLLVTPSGKLNVSGYFELCSSGARKRHIQIKVVGIAISKITTEVCL